jgi:aminoglycoside 6-adenylyltransferase
MQPAYTDIINNIRTWSQQTEDIEGVIIIGSQARNVLLADQWSDLDLMVLVRTPDTFLNGNQWLNRFGNVVCAFNYITPLHFTTWDWCVKRALLDDNRDIDFSILPYDYLDEVLVVNQDIMAKGYRVIYDARAPQLETKIAALVAVHKASSTTPPTEDELCNVVNDLLFHIIWALKKIKRGELWVAVNDINQHISGLLLHLIEWHTISVTHKSASIIYDGRFLEMRADGEILRRLRGCFTNYDPADAIETLGHLVDITHFISQELFEVNGYELDADQFEEIGRLYRAMKEGG